MYKKKTNKNKYFRIIENVNVLKIIEKIEFENGNFKTVFEGEKNGKTAHFILWKLVPSLNEGAKVNLKGFLSKNGKYILDSIIILKKEGKE